MSDDTTVEAAEVALEADETQPAEEAHAHPPYMLVFGILFVLTMGEVFYAFLELPKFWLAAGLIAMAVWKALLVALYYMHLRFEPRRLWVLAASPIPLAVILVIVVIQEF